MSKKLLRAELFPKLIDDCLDVYPDISEMKNLVSKYKLQTKTQFEFEIFLSFIEDTIIKYEHKF